MSLDYSELFNRLRQRAWLIALLAVLAGASAVAGTIPQPKVYRATGKLLFEGAQSQVLDDEMSLDAITQQARMEREFYNTQIKTITSRTVLQDAAARLGLARDEDYLEARGLGSSPTPRALEGALRSVVDVSPDRGSRIVIVTAEGFDPERAARIANTVGQAYIDHTLEVRLESTREASKWLDARVQEFSRSLEEQERRLNDFKKTQRLVSVPLEDRQNIASTNLALLNQALVETQTKLIGLASERSVLRRVSEGKARIDSVPRIAANAVVEKLRTSLVEVEGELAALSARYGDSWPDVVAARNRAKTLKTALDQEIERAIAALENEVVTQERMEAKLQEAIEQQKAEALAVNEVGLEYKTLNRRLGTTKDIYESLLKRQTEADLSGLLKSSFVRWFEQAEPSRSPVRPSLPKNALLGGLAGLALGLLLVVGEVLLDNTVRTRADVEDYLGLPFLGIYPSLRQPSSSKADEVQQVDLFPLRHPKSGAAECARAIRTNLLFMGASRPLKKLLLTSARPGEGKTSTTVALGISMAQTDQKVLLVDTDLRKPRLHNAFGVPSGEGITSVLMGKPVDECIRSTELSNLDILPCGVIPPNPSELLHSEVFRQFLNDVGERYDRILLDSPPVLPVTDSSILAQVTDGTLLVVQAGVTTKDSARRALDQLNNVQSGILGVVLNDFDSERDAGSREAYYEYVGYQYGD